MAFNTPSNLSIGPTATRAVVCRSPVYPLWTDQSQVVPWCYTVTHDVDPATYTPTVSPAITTVGTDSSSIVSAYPRVIGATPPWGYPLVGIDATVGSQPFVYAGTPGSATAVSILVCVNKDSAAQWTSNLLIDIWQGPGQVMTVESENIMTSATSDFFTYNVPATLVGPESWIRVKAVNFINFVNTSSGSHDDFDATVTIVVSNRSISWSAESLGSVNVPVATCTGSPGTGNLLLPASTPREFINSPLPWCSTKVTAAAALFTNVTKVQNKEGTVMWGRLNPVLTPMNKFSKTDLVGLHPMEKAFLPLETGCYTYVAPSTDLVDFSNYTLATNSGHGRSMSSARIPLFRLDNIALYNAAVFEDPDGGTALAVNLDWHIEFRTSSTLFQIGFSKLPVEALHQAQLALTEGGFFFKNDTHTRILNAIASAASLAGKVLPLVTPYGNAIRGAAAAADLILNNRPKQQMQSTSAQNSGWLHTAKQGARSVPVRPAIRSRKKSRQNKVTASRSKQKMKSGLDMYLQSKQNIARR